MPARDLNRRALLRLGAEAALGAAAAAALAACGAGGSETSRRRSATTATMAPTTVAADSSRPWWLRDNFAPVSREVEAFDLPVHGEIPRELDGLYVRNGSNPLPGDSPHWFLGDGMVHGVLLSNGRASWYRNRYVRTSLLAAGGGLTASGAPGGAAGLSNVSIIHHAGRLLTLGEVGLPYELSTRDLSTIGVHDFGGRLNGNVTAHPKIDPATGSMHFFGYNFTEPYLTYSVADRDGSLVSSEPVAVGAPTMIHDFAITDRDVIFWEMPVLFDMDLAIRMVNDPASGVMPFVWKPEYGARVGVMPLGGPASDIRWVEIEPCYVFHGMNAYRQGDDVVVDVCRLAKVFDGSTLGPPPQLHRWTIDTSGAALMLRDDVRSDRTADLPTIDRRSTGRDYRYGWRVEVVDDPDTVVMTGVVCDDARTGREMRWTPKSKYASGEWLFVATGDREGEGVVMSYVHDRTDGVTELVILDAQDVGAGPLARAVLPQRVPYGFHATWVPAGEA
jgi:carotenoid cleavage dioxygenase